MVGNQPEALRGLESQWQVEARWDQPRTDGPELWSAPTVPDARNGSTLHPGSVKKASGRMAVLRRARAVPSATVYRLDRVREARGNEGQTPEGGDSPLGGRQAARTQMQGL